MISYIIRRILMAIPLLIVISIISFVLIQLPPGDYMTTLESQLTSQAGMTSSEAREVSERVRKAYGLDQPMITRYLIWIKGMVTEGRFGFSFMYKKDAGEVIWDRIGKTLLLALTCQLFSLAIGVFIGVYSATHQYSLGDNFATFGIYWSFYS